jgi:hypothetical protein
MGKVKMRLAAEAEADKAASSVAIQPSQALPLAPSGMAATSANSSSAPSTADAGTTARSDETPIKIPSGQGVEVKLEMQQGAKAEFSWTAEGGVVNFHAHGDGGGRSVSYERGRSVRSGSGVILAAFDGDHGWYWLNRGESEVMVLLRTAGEYSAVKRAR